MIKYVMATYLPEESQIVDEKQVMEGITETFPKDKKDITVINLNNMDEKTLTKFIEMGAIDTFVFTPETIISGEGKQIISKVLKADLLLNKNTHFLNVYDSKDSENVQKSLELGKLLLEDEYKSKLTHLDIDSPKEILSQNLKGMKNDAIKAREILQKKDEDILDFAKKVVDHIEVDKDEYTAKHIRSVATIAEAIARNMGLSNDDVDILKIGALLHDIGKDDVSDDVLKKPSRLTDDEFKEMKSHVAFGEAELNFYDLGKYERAKIIAAEHHERYDGKGYPRGLKGEEIDMFSRIVSLADATQAMFGRSYQSGKTKSGLIEELHKFAGTQFDPKMVDVLYDVLEKQPETIHVSYDEEGRIKYEVPEVEDIIGNKDFLGSLQDNVKEEIDTNIKMTPQETKREKEL